MKNLIILIGLLFISSVAFAQAPVNISYQSVIRNTDGTLLSNTQVGVEVLILQGSSSGTIVFSEFFIPTTNENGLVSLEIGNGDPVFGSLEDIDWAQGPYFSQVNIDPNGGTNFTISGVSQLLSVPYALYANNSGNSEAISWTINGDNIVNNNAGNVSIGTDDASAKLNVGGNIKADNIQLTEGAAENKVLVSDVEGNASWGDVPLTTRSISITPGMINENNYNNDVIPGKLVTNTNFTMPTLDMEDVGGAPEIISFNFPKPADYQGGALTFRILYTSTATEGVFDCTLGWRSTGVDGNLLEGPVGNNFTMDTPSTANELKEHTQSFTIDQNAEFNFVLFERRSGASSSVDTAQGTLRILGFVIEYQAR